MKKITFLFVLITTTLFSQTKQLDSYIGYEYDTAISAWVEDYKSDFTYNSNHKNTDELSYYNDDGNWSLSFERHYTYDANNNVIEINSQNVGENPHKKILSYDADNNLTQKARLVWNTTTNQFENSYKEIHNFSNNLKTESITFDWNNSQWETNYKKTFQYNANNLVEEIKHFRFNNTTNQWDIAHQKITRQYNGNNKLIEQIEYYYDNGWVNLQKLTYQYNGNNKRTEQIKYNAIDGVWVADNKIEYVYDAINLIEKKYSRWSVESNIWKDREKTNLTQYDNNYDFSTLALPYDFTQDNEETLRYFTHMITELIVQTKEASSWANNEKIELFYSNTTAATNDVLKEPLNIYPNPFTNELHFNLANSKIIKLTLFDIQGRKVFDKPIINTKKINVNTLENGIYFYEAISNNNKYKGKLIKK